VAGAKNKLNTAIANLCGKQQKKHVMVSQRRCRQLEKTTIAQVAIKTNYKKSHKSSSTSAQNDEFCLHELDK